MDPQKDILGQQVAYFASCSTLPTRRWMPLQRTSPQLRLRRTLSFESRDSRLRNQSISLILYTCPQKNKRHDDQRAEIQDEDRAILVKRKCVKGTPSEYLY